MLRVVQLQKYTLKSDSVNKNNNIVYMVIFILILKEFRSILVDLTSIKFCM